MNILEDLYRRALGRPKYGINALSAASLGGGAFLGMGLMYMLDPDRGARRRALLRDRAVHVSHAAGDLLDKGSRDLRYRARGVIAETRHRFKDDDVPDEVLVERVRAKLGRFVAHPHAIDVKARSGRVILSGPVLAHEADRLLAAVHRVHGVTDIEDLLDVHATSDGVPSLQGGILRQPRRALFLRRTWSPLERIVADLGGVALVVGGASLKSPLGYGLGALGGLILLRGLSNQPVQHLLGVGVGRGVVSFQKTIHVNVPVEEAFALWSDFESFPQFMSHVRAITRRPGGRYRWVVSGPAGVPVAWDAIVTSYVTNRLISWKSVTGSIIRNAGTVRFDREPDGRTRIDVKMTYNPPLGAIGHAVAAFFGSDPRHAMNDDLLRFQSLLERGKTSAHGAHVIRSQIGEGLIEGEVFSARTATNRLS